MTRAAAEQDKLFFIEIFLPDRDSSAGLKRLGESFRKK